LKGSRDEQHGCKSNNARLRVERRTGAVCLPSASRDANLKLAWVNSICILFLLIGIAGARRGHHFHQARSAHTGGNVPVIVLPTGDFAAASNRPKAGAGGTRIQRSRASSSSCRTPNVNFGVPTVGTLVVPAALASAPPLQPLAAPRM
jgi:hypothetical protein